MFELLGELIWIGATAAAAFVGYVQTRRFVRKRLQFVDAAHKPNAKFIAGGIATAVAVPIVWALPIVGGVTAVAFGVSVGLGVSHGSKDTKRLAP